MLVTQPQGKIVERIVRTKTGVFVLATFFVFQGEGELQVRLLSVKPAEKPNGFKIPARTPQAGRQDSRLKNKTLCLAGKCAKSAAVISYKPSYHGVASPFANIFEFFISQPTRAPSQ